MGKNKKVLRIYVFKNQQGNKTELVAKKSKRSRRGRKNAATGYNRNKIKLSMRLKKRSMQTKKRMGF